MSSTTCFKCDSMNDADEIITRGVSVGESPTKSDIRNGGHHPEDGVSIRRRSTSNSSVNRRTAGHGSREPSANSNSAPATHHNSHNSAERSHAKVCVGTRCNVCNRGEFCPSFCILSFVSCVKKRSKITNLLTLEL